VIQDGSFTNVRELMDRQTFVDKSATEAGEELKSEQAPVLFPSFTLMARLQNSQFSSFKSRSFT
jgi:hypothetical protein